MKIRKLEIARVLIVSTAHIRPQDQALLEEQEQSASALIVYSKAEYGWLILCDKRPLDKHVLSAELIALIRLARAQGCTWLMLDRDGPIYPQLATFDW